jgi:hypothetical protein
MRNKMRKSCLLFIAALLLVLAGSAIQSEAGVSVSFGIALPPPVVFSAPPDVIVLPDTNDVYVVPDIGVDIFFWNGWWWRPWEGRWYRSHYYDRGWAYYNYVPRFYYDVDPGWRRYYRDHDWHGHRWNYERIPDHRLQSNWRNWNSNRHWERQKTWGVQSYRPRPYRERQELRHQRQKQYQQMPEVQRHQQQRQEKHRKYQPGQSEVRHPQGQQQRHYQQKQPEVRHPQGQQGQEKSRH